MKKRTAFLAGILLALGVCACGGADAAQEPSEAASQPTAAGTPVQASDGGNFDTPAQNPGGGNSDTPAQVSGGGNSAASAQRPEDGGAGAGMPAAPDDQGGDAAGKTLVVYYSASGNTKAAAEYIAEAANGDLFELVPVIPYSDDDLDWTDTGSRVVYEHDHPEMRAVELAETTVSDWESYDTVFIGYPIWWGIAAWPVDGFIAANDFTGKTVIPFCTSSSSGLGESGELLREAAGAGDWLEGKRFSSYASEDTVKEWVDGLGLTR